MVASYTTDGRLTKQGTNDNPNTWGAVLNTQVITLIEEMAVGVEDVDLTGSSNVTLTTNNGATDQARNHTLQLTGAIGANIELLLPAVNWRYFLDASWTGAFTVTVKISGSSTSVVMNTGDKKIVYTDGTDTFDMVDVPDALLISNNLSDVASAATSRTNLGLGDLATQDAVDLLASVYPVGSMYMNANNATNPATLLGFGTWSSAGQGRMLVGVGVGTDINTNQQTFIQGEMGGEYTHAQTETELAAHTHSEQYHNFSTGDANGGIGIRFAGTQTQDSGSTGDGTPMPWLQPYLSVHIWQRTA